MSEQRFGEAIAMAQRAVEVAPSLDPPHFILGMALLADDQPVAAFEHVRTAVRINPRGPPTYLTMLGLMNFRAGRSNEAIELWERVRRENVDMVHARILLVGVYASTRPDEAQRIAREIQRINPELTAETAVELFPGRFSQGSRETWRQSLRQAGFQD